MALRPSALLLVASTLVAAAAHAAAPDPAPPGPTPEAAAPSNPGPVLETPPPAGAVAAPRVEGKTAWFVEPLYPGQEMLVARTQEALAKMLATTVKDQIIGAQALAAYLSSRKPSLGCLTGDVACNDPVDAFVASLGLERVVLLKGGQDEQGYHFRMTSYVPATGEVASGDGRDKSLEKALLAAMIKLVALASTIEVDAEPKGATVWIDGEKVGVTPYSGQILPGERTVRLEAASHMPVEKKIDVPIRGALRLSETLEKVPARLVVVASPPGTTIAVDGKAVGKDKYDAPTQPGRHRVTLAAEGHLPLEEVVDIAPGSTFTFERKLEMTGWTSFKHTMGTVQDDIYSRKSYAKVAFEYASLKGDALYLQKDISEDFANSTLAAQALEASALPGISLEYGQDGRYFGVAVIGVTLYKSGSDWRYTLGHTTSFADADGDGVPDGSGPVLAATMAVLQPHLRLALWRFLLLVQAGFEGRAIYVKQAVPDNSTEVWSLDLNASYRAGLRFYAVEGLFVEGTYRGAYSFSSKRAPFQGFNVGIGYAF